MRVGIIGAGMIGSTLAKLWVDAGHKVRVASRHPEQLKELVERLGELASAGTPTDAAEFGDVVMLTVPLKAVSDLATDLRSSLSRKVVLDTGTRMSGATATSRVKHRHTRRAPLAGRRRCFLRLAGSKRSTRCTSKRSRAKHIAAGIALASRSPAMIPTPSEQPPTWSAMRASIR
jgi:prephenate dehydrogenase